MQNEYMSHDIFMKKNVYKARFLHFIIPLVCVFIIGLVGSLCVQRLPSTFLRMRLPIKGQLIHAIAMNMSPRVAYEVLVRLVDSENTGLMHDLMPIIGESAYRRIGVSAYRFCDTLTHPLPCYYGVMLGAVQKLGYSTDTISVIANYCKQSVQSSSSDRCLQGVGYTILYLNTYWYIESLLFCDGVFNSENERYQCWIGVTHENVNRVGDILHGLFEVPWTKDNIYYPCDSIPLVYQLACASEQMLAIRARIYRSDTKLSAAYCSHFVHNEIQNSCINALIYTLRAEAIKQNSHDITQCRNLPSQYVDLCIREFQR